MAFVIVVAVAILVGYAASIWWVLRGENRDTLLSLAVVWSLALALHVVFTNDYPPGLNEDETRTLILAQRTFEEGDLLGIGLEGPLLLNTLFQAPLAPWLGGRWAVRFYSNLTGMLALPVGFAIARAIGLRVAASLAFTVFLAALPWGQFYARITWGGELTFHQLLVVVGVVRLIFAQGGLPEVLMAGLGLSLLLYSYPGGWIMVGMPFAGLLLARGRRRWASLAILLVAAAAIAPYYVATLHMWIDEVTSKVPSSYSTDPVQTAIAKAINVLAALVGPYARNGWMTVRAAAIHPVWLLVLAFFGSFTGWRRAIFLWGSFLGTFLPTVLSDGEFPSAHRMMTMFPFLSLAAACALDRLPGRLATPAALAAAIAVTIQGSLLFFSPTEFWYTESRWVFDPEKTDAVEAIDTSLPSVIVLSPDLGPYFQVREHLTPADALEAHNWYPLNNTRMQFAFGPLSGDLQPYYFQLLGADRVKSFGRSFIATFPYGDWSWMKERGWWQEQGCGEFYRANQVPVVFRLGIDDPRIFCPGGVTTRWTGIWNGPPALLRFLFHGRGTVETPRGTAERVAHESGIDFVVYPGDPMKLTLNAEGFLPVGVVMSTPGGDRVPLWDYVIPSPGQSVWREE